MRAEREIRENADLCTKAPVKKTLPAGLAQHASQGKRKSMFIICKKRLPQNLHDDIHVATASTRICGLRT